MKNNYVNVKSENLMNGMKKSKLGFPDVVYPEIMIILDKKLFS